jgi:hypothetical protein
MQVGERLDNHTISLLEPLRAFRFCSADNDQTDKLFKFGWV